MRILLIRSINPFFENGASANRFVGLINGLTRNKIQITLVITGGFNSIEEYRLNGYKLNNQYLKVYYTITTFNHNIWLRRINLFLIPGILRKINQYKIKRFFLEDYSYIWLTYNADVLNSFNHNYEIITAQTFIEINEYNDLFKETGATGNKLQYNLALLCADEFNKALKNINYFAIMTKTLINYYQNLAIPEAKFIHLPMTVDLSRFKNIKDSNKYKKPYIAFTGTFNNTKDGVDILIQSFAKIAKKYNTHHLYLAGFHHYDVAIQKKIIDQFDLKEKVSYLGVLNNEDIPDFIYSADLLVLSRPNSHQAQGGFPTKLGEYLATGKPVCVTKVGEIPDYLEDNYSAFMAEAGNIDSFAYAMDRALNDRENAIRVGLNGRKVAETIFNVDVQSARLIDFLKENLK